MALLVASRAAEFPKPWKSEGSAALALPSVIQHSPVQKLCECPADFRAREPVETICKSVLWLSWLPHTLVSSPNLGKAKVRPPSPCRPSYSRSKSVLYDECSTGGAFDPPTQRTIILFIIFTSFCLSEVDGFNQNKLVPVDLRILHCIRQGREIA